MPRMLDDSTLHYELSGYRYVNINSSDSENGERSSLHSEDPCIARLEKIVRDQRLQIDQLKRAVADLQSQLQQLSRGNARNKGSRVGTSGYRVKPEGKRPAHLASGASSECLSPAFYQSTNSLHSDGVSGSPSGSPISTPSPTLTQLRQNGKAVVSNLDKRWRSTSDFNVLNRCNSAKSQRPRTYMGSTSNLLTRRDSASPGVALLHRRRHQLHNPADLSTFREPSLASSPRRTVYGSMADISRRRILQQNKVAKHLISDMSYNEEQGSLRIYLKGRPVNLFAPTEVQQGFELETEVPPPQQQLTVEWVYGYRGKDCRNNLYLLPTGELLYFTAGVVVLHSLSNNEQRHYTSHTDDIKCLAVHPNRYTVATGQCAGTRPNSQPQVHVWDSVSLTTLRVLGVDVFDRSVSCLSFSLTDGGCMLACVDEGHQDRVLSVWDWQNDKKLAETKASTDTVVDVQWHPMDDGVLVTCGKQHVCFWLVESCGGGIQRRQGVFGSRDRPRYVSCLAFTACGDLVSGDSDGRLLVWQRGGNQVAKTIREAHQGAIFSLHVSCDGNIISAGKDGKIVEWDSEFNKTGNSIDVPESLGAPRIVSPGRNGQLIIGTLRNCIAVANWSQVDSPIVVGHTDEVWAMAVHPGGEKFITGAWDSQLLLWNSVDHRIIWQMSMESGVQSCVFSPDGSRLAVGLTSGHWLVLDPESQQQIYSRAEGEEPHQVIKFSPDGAHLAIGSRDNNIYVYRENENGDVAYSRAAKFTGHSSYVTHLDWSTDNSTIRSNSGDYELLFWSVESGRQLTHAADTRDLTWLTETCTLSFNTIGIFPEGADGTDVNTCACSLDKSVIASGDDFGKVKLFSYPASHPRSGHHSYLGHSSHVTGVEFCGGDRQMMSCGGRDHTIIQWNVE